MQAPLQSFSPAFAQLHAPLTQLWPPEQVVPQAPQLFTSVAVLTQTPLQAVCPAEQAHAPLTQLRPPEQTVPQVPQLLASLAVFTQFPLQSVCPAVHAHAPLVQV
jgi:hypothetical protein